jgi:hypothetical protein
MLFGGEVRRADDAVGTIGSGAGLRDGVPAAGAAGCG